ncbi:carbohydrate ABC transporter permease [Microlunatus parietis]|uniref:Raffinose/stachyose/melibiose transport system permease protein n=1 Tax=Microlunatus parietis TaxID=682979 RepID=A0A7Y9I4T1_9ACTN|nr:sugar ABC transporter permease [Microlunatus parietis]NYE70015.1 raffinose/stachyose/melibiose transport system permease protein [Microlunatus parietis]
MSPEASSDAARRSPVRRARWHRREDRVGYAMLVPSLLPYVAFALLPISWLLWFSFQRWNGFSAPQFTGPANYQRMAGDEQWWDAVLNTLKFGFGRLIIEIPLALLLAYVFFRGVRGGTFYRTIFFLPHVLSPAIIGIIFVFLLRETGGPVNQLLTGSGLLEAPVRFLGEAGSALGSLIGVAVWAHLGINLLLFFAGMMTIPNELLESAALDGAGHWATLRHIVMPMLAPVTRVVILISIIGTLRSFDLVKTLTDGGPAGSTEVMFTYLYRFFFEPEAVPQIGYAAALGISASVVVGIISVAYLRLSRSGRTAA